MITIIAAIAQNGVIGRADGVIPWRLKSDMRYFKAATMGKPMIMGRKTFDTFGGKPLPGRPHIVISHQVPDTRPIAGKETTPQSDVIYVNSFVRAYAIAKQYIRENTDNPEIMVIGGGQIYKEALPYCDKMLLTTVYASPDGEVKFPTEDINWNQWVLKSRTAFPGDVDNDHVFDFAVWERVGKVPKPFLVNL